MKNYRKSFILFLVVFVCAGFLSCSTAKKVKNMVVSSSEPKKKVGFIGIANKTEFQVQDYAEDIQNVLLARLQKSNDLLILSPQELESAEFKAPISRNVAELASYIPKAKALGLNALVKGDISELDLGEELHGIYGFRKEKPTLKIIIRAQLIDVESRTVLYEGYKRADLTLNVQEGSSLKDYLAQKGKIPIHFVTDIVQDMGSDMIDVMAEQRWKSYITKIDSGEIQFNAGRDVNVREGSVMEVWSQGKTVQNYAGQSFVMPGERIGLVRCESVEDKTTISKILEGENFQFGDVITVHD